MRHNWKKPLAGVVLSLGCMLLAACASSGPQIERYVLPAADTVPAQTKSNAALLRIAPVRLSGLVNRRGLLLQTSDIQVHEAVNHQWAEELAPQLQRSLLRYLAAQLPSRQLQTAASAVDGDLLIVRVEQFQGRYDGQAIVSGQWQLLNAQRQTLQSQRFLFKQALQDDGYAALVRSLDQAWQSLAQQIAQALQASSP